MPVAPQAKLTGKRQAWAVCSRHSSLTRLALRQRLRQIGHLRGVKIAAVVVRQCKEIRRATAVLDGAVLLVR